MSNLLKSKYLLGVMILAAVVIAFAFAMFATTALAADCSITSTLRVGSKGDQVKCLQAAVGATADGIFGPKTKAAVVAWQASVGLVADGVFGPKSNAAWSGGSMSMTYPAGCTSGTGYSPTTGMPCTGMMSGYPAGCTSASGFSATTGQPCSGGTVISGPVGVSLASDNPASGTVVATQATADIAHFTFTGSGTVTAVTLKRIGVSGDSTLSNVYLFDGATRLTDAASVSSNGIISFNVPAGIFTVSGSKTISVKSDILTGTSGQTVGVMLATFTTSGGTMTANLSGNIHTVASATLAAVALSGTVTPTGATLSPAANVTVWQATFSVSQRDVWMKRIALRNTGSAPASAFINFKLYVNGVVVGTASGLDINGYVTFDLTAAPVLLVAGSRVVRVDVDLVSGASRTALFSLRQAADVDFVDSNFGVNIAPTSTPWASATANTISGSSGGSLTIEKDVSSPSVRVVNQASDANIATFKFTAYGEAIKVETLRATYASSDVAISELRNGRILIGGVQYGSSTTLNEDSHATTAYTSYTVNYTFMPGVPVMVELHADIFDNDGTDSITAGTDTINGSLAIGSSNATRQDSLGSFNAPAVAVTSNTLTISTASITLAKNSTYANQNTSLPSTNFKIGSWNLAGSSVEDVLLTTLGFDIREGLSGTEFDEGDITNMYPVVKNSSGSIVAQPSPIATLGTGADQNFSINYTLVKNTNVTIELFANLADDTLDMVAGVSGGTDAIDATDGFDTVLQVSGTSLVSGATVTGGNGTTTVVGQNVAFAAATITTSKDASSPVTAIAYDNQTLTTLAAKFETVTAGFRVTDLTITVGASADTVVQNVMLYDGATLVATAPLSTTTTAVFSGLAWEVPANTSKVLTVKLQLGTVGVNAGTTGSTITTSIAAATDFTAVNTSTGASATGAGTATGSTTYAYASIPTVTKVELTTTEATLAAGTKVLARFTVASNGGTVAWKQVLFDITKIAAPTIASVTLWDVTGGGNTEITSAKVFQNGSGGVATTCSSDNTICELLISVGTNADDNVEEQVSGSKTYEVRATIAGTLAAANSISTSIQSNLAHVTSVAYTGTDNDLTVDDASFVWSDISAQSHDTGTTDWTNENLVKVLPTSTWTMTYPN